MRRRRSVGRTGVLLLGLVCVLGLALAPGALAQSTQETAGNASGFGAQVSAFAQASAADANGSMDRGMWAAGVAEDGPPGQAVRERARDLETRLDALENESASLADGNASDVADVARASAVSARLANLREAVNQTMTTAEHHGVNASALEDLRRKAGNATGPEIASIARNVTDAGRSPPDWAGEGGPPADGPGAGQGNETAPGDGGPPDDHGSGDGGPPDDQGSGDGGPGDGGAGDGGAETDG